MKKEEKKTILINNLRKQYCDLFCKLMDNSYAWAIKNYKKNDIVKILDELIYHSESNEILIFK